MKRLLPLVAVLALLPSCLLAPKNYPPPPTYKRTPPTEPIHLTLIGTNDIHGWVAPHDTKLDDGTMLYQGGLAVFGGYLKILRDENPGGTLLLDGGDLFQGTLASNLTEGRVVMEAMNQLGYQAAAIGNHEFDYGPDGPVTVATEEGQDPFGALKARIKQAKFPLLAINIYDTKAANRPEWLGNDGTLMIEAKGVRVGIVGLVTPQTPVTTNPVNVQTIRFGSLAPELASAARKLRERGAHIVVAVAHAGAKCAEWKDPKDLSSCDRTGEVFEMLDNVPPGTVDAVIAGHTHAPLGHFINGTPVIETWGQARDFGTIDLYLDPVKKTVITDRTVITPVIPICEKFDAETKNCDPRKLKTTANLVPAVFHGKPVEIAAPVQSLLAPALAEVDAQQQRLIGVKVPKHLGRSYEAESPLGDVLADALREAEGADVALLNSGGLRADVPAGDLRYGQVFEVLPFDNTIATLRVTGEELKRLLLSAYGARKGVFQESGLKLKLSQCPGLGRLKGITFTDGKPLVPEKQYKVVLPDFLARGGDGLGSVMQSIDVARVDMGMSRELNFRDTLVAHWQKRKVDLVAPKPGRLSFLEDGEECNAGAKMDLQAGGHK